MAWSNNKHFEGDSNACSNSVRPYTPRNKNLQSKTKPTLTRTIKKGCIAKKLKILKSKQKTGKTLADTFQSELDEDSFPPSPNPNTKSHNFSYMIINKDELCTTYIGITG